LKPVKVGVLGLGTVGGGTVNVLKRNAAEIARRAGRGNHYHACLGKGFRQGTDLRYPGYHFNHRSNGHYQRS